MKSTQTDRLKISVVVADTVGGRVNLRAMDQGPDALQEARV